jgi:hypothetical protein
MQPQTIRTSMFIAAMLAASASFAGADVVKCVDQDGHVTLTDAQCHEGAAMDVVAGAHETPVPAASDELSTAPAVPAVRRVVQRVVVQDYVLPPGASQQTAWSSPRPASRPLARDVETLKAAKLSLQVMDEASAALRHQRLAGLN